MRIFTYAAAAFKAVRLAVLLLLLSVVGACSADNRGVLHTAKGDFAFTLEIADTEASRERGLMFRDAIAPRTTWR